MCTMLKLVWDHPFLFGPYNSQQFSYKQKGIFSIIVLNYRCYGHHQQTRESDNTQNNHLEKKHTWKHFSKFNRNRDYVPNSIVCIIVTSPMNTRCDIGEYPISLYGPIGLCIADPVLNAQLDYTMVNLAKLS